MKIPDNFILAALFSQIGRLQKRAEGTAGPVKDCSQRWLEEKIPRAAQFLATWETLIEQAAFLALGLETPLPEADQQRFTVDAGDVSIPLTSLFSTIPASNGKLQIRSLPVFSSQECIYPVEATKVSTSEYKNLWDTLNQLVTKAGADLSPEAAMTLLEQWTVHVPCLLPVEGDQRADRFSDISFFDHIKMITAIASCLYAHAMEHAEGREEEAAKFEPKAGEEIALLVGGDFSGVQEFIYRISSKGALKAVRGRSFFLELLTQHVVAELLEATDCSRANILYAAGAQFSLLLPNTDDARTAIARVRREINTYLIQVHRGKLALILEDRECSKDDLLGEEKKGWAHARAELGGKLGRRIARKFLEFFQNEEPQDQQKPAVSCQSCQVSVERVGKEELERWGLSGPLCRFCFLLTSKNAAEQHPRPPTLNEFSQALRECLWCKATELQVWSRVGEEIVVGCKHPLCLGNMQPGECAVCHRQTLLSPLPTPEVQGFTEGEAKGEKPPEPELILVCPFCRNLYHVGEHLPDLRYVCRSKKQPSVQPRMLFNIDSWFYEFPEKDTDFIQSLGNDPTAHGWIINGDQAVPPSLVSRPISPLSLGNYHPESKALDFSDFARASIGSQLIGVLRMDVDNLGELLTRKIPEEAMTPVRTATLSRLLTRFFTGFINALCGGEGLPLDQKEPFWLFPEGRFDQSSKKRWVTVVYSGGDDLFIVGAWSDVIELAFDIHTAFRCYVCDHSDITLSGGMIVQHENFPLYQMASLAKDAEDKAKENEQPLKTLKEPHRKDTFAPFYIRDQNAFFWEKTEKLCGLAKDLVKYLKDSQTPVNQRLRLKVPRAFLTQMFEIVEIYKQEGKLYLPRLAYVLAHDEIPKELKHKLLSLETINYLYPVLVWLELLSRGEELHA
jgi:uncharacterized protein with PIN domain